MAQAGYYKTVYTSLGNTVLTYPDGTTQTKTYSTVANQDILGAVNVLVYEDGGASVHCSGTIQAKLVWQPDPILGVQDDPPPKCVVVMESAFAQTMYSGAHGSATTGYTGERVSFVPYYLGDALTEGKEFRRYRVVNDPGAEIPLDPCNAEIFADFAYHPYAYWNHAGAILSYLAAATPLVIPEGGAGKMRGTNGPYVSRGERLLIGQRLKVTLATPQEFYLDKNSTGNDPTCQWAVAGTADPFKRFYHNQVGSYESVGRREDLASGDLNGRQLLCSFGKEGTANVFLTAHIALPPNALPTAGLDVSYSSSVEVQRPILTPFLNGGSGKMSFLDVVLGRVVLTYTPTAVPNWYINLTDANDPTGTANQPSGITFRAGITTPSDPFKRKNADGSDDLGGWVWIQTVTEGSTRVGGNDGSTNTVTQVEMIVPDPPGSYPSYSTGLDFGFPYSPTTPRDLKNVVDSKEGFQMFVANGVPGFGRDTPGELIYRDESTDPDFPKDGNNQRLPIRAYRISEDFTTWQMYKAPGDDSQWVPVQSFRWWFRATLNWDGSGWTYVLPERDSDHGYRAQTAFSAAVLWPSWTRKFDTSSLHYVTSN